MLARPGLPLNSRSLTAECIHLFRGRNVGQIHFVLVCAGARPLIRASSFDQSFLISDCLTSATAPAARGRCRCTSSSSTSTRTWPHTSRSARRPASRQIGSRWVTQTQSETDRTAEETENVTLLSLNHTAGDIASQLSQGMVAPAPQSQDSVRLHEQVAN